MQTGFCTALRQVELQLSGKLTTYVSKLMVAYMLQLVVHL